jgi:hypothetical protein
MTVSQLDVLRDIADEDGKLDRGLIVMCAGLAHVETRAHVRSK